MTLPTQAENQTNKLQERKYTKRMLASVAAPSAWPAIKIVLFESMMMYDAWRLLSSVLWSPGVHSRLVRGKGSTKIINHCLCAIFQVITAFALAFWADVKLTASALSLFPVIAVLFVFFGNLSSKRVNQQAQAYAKVAAVASEDLGLVRTIWAFCTQRFERTRSLRRCSLALILADTKPRLPTHTCRSAGSSC
jgi:ABC-type multidrug transport system fused ATPase/permease subunit